MENNNTIIDDAGMVLEADRIRLHAEHDIIGRDHIEIDEYIEEHHYYYDTPNGFVDIDLEPYSEEHYVVPQFAGRLTEQLKANRLLLITGTYGFDKESFARHLAWCIINDHKEIKAKEWNTPSDNISDLAKTILEEESPVIFIVNQISPKDVDFDLDKIKRNVEQRSHFVVFTSDLPIKAWQQPEHILRKHWFDIPDHHLYSHEVLQNILIGLLEKNQALLSFETSFIKLEPDTALTAKHSVHTLARIFQTPEQIVYFTEMLCMQEGPLSAVKVDKILADFLDKSEPLISKWFKNLNRNEKMLVLGASLFEGLYEDQFFGVMQNVTDEFWHFRSPDLQALDYDDLDFMMNFFKFEEYNSSFSIFKGRFPNQRTDIVKAAWNTHRRHIIAALPVLVNIGRNSRSGRYMNSGIYSSRERRLALRSIIAELLSDIGMIAIQLAEDRLLEFAVENDEPLQRVTAKALARWRAYGKEALLFEVLDRWSTDPKIRAKALNIIQGNKGQRSTAAMIYLNSTILLTLKYVAEYDAPHQLHEEIIHHLQRIASERNNVLNTRLGPMLSEIIGKHYRQMKDVLPRGFMIYNELERPIIKGICEAYAKDPQEVKHLMEYWFLKCMEDVSPDDRENQFPQRDEILILVLRIYQRIPYSGSDDVITIEYVWTLIQQLYKVDLPQTVREMVLETIGVFISIDPEYSLTQLEQLFAYAGLNEREIILSGLVEVYMEQRKDLEGADYRVMIHGEWYPSFANKARPLTAIEKNMYVWLNGKNVFARQVALLSFMEFAKGFDLEEDTAIPELIEAERTDTYQRPVTKSSAENRTSRGRLTPVDLYEPELTFFDQILIWWWLLFESPENKDVFRSLLKTMLQHHTWFNQYHVRIVINKMNAQSLDRLNRIGKWLDRWFRRIIK